MSSQVPEELNRRSSDQDFGVRVVRFLENYSRDVWLFITTILVMVALVFALLAQQNTADVAQDAKDQAKSACLRAQVVIPIQVKALRSAVEIGVITAEELGEYERQLPERC